MKTQYIFHQKAVRQETIFLRIFTFVVVFLFGLCGFTLSQPAPAPYHFQPYILDSGRYNGQEAPGTEAFAAFTETVRIEDVPWLRLNFSGTNLGNNSYVIITSLLDGAWQRLDDTSMGQWQNSSAYFNGDAVNLRLYVAPGDENIYLKIDEVMVGEWEKGDDPPIESQCGPTDDRVSSNIPAVGRIVSLGCTGWIVSNGLQVTAGHCFYYGGMDVLEFNVPPSLTNGTIQHPDPEDQYAIITSTSVWSNGGIGNDWAVFEVFNNSITGLQPIDAQGAYFETVQDLGPANIRITGYGVDYGVDNQTQQTHVGPNVGSSGTTMRYQTDTQGGNSGSPVIDDATGFSVGVHTHGGCTTGGGGVTTKGPVCLTRRFGMR